MPTSPTPARLERYPSLRRTRPIVLPLPLSCRDGQVDHRAVVSSCLELFSMAEGGYELYTESPGVEHGKSELSGPHSGPGLPRGFLMLPCCRASRASGLRPQMVWPLWPGCALLVAVLLLLPRGIWPILIAAGLAGFVLYDLQEGLTLRSIALLTLANTVEILIASLGVSYFCPSLPCLNSVASLARYSFLAVILAPMAAAFVSTSAFSGNYWIRWRIAFFTEALALLTLTPAILACVGGMGTEVPCFLF